MTLASTCSTICLSYPRRTALAGKMSIAPVLMQVRGKQTTRQPKHRGVVVRLLGNMPGVGRVGTVLRVNRERMRNQWYPKRKAEYMTSLRFKELGLTKDDIGKRDPFFGTQVEQEEEVFTGDAVDAVADQDLAEKEQDDSEQLAGPEEMPDTPSASTTEIAENISPSRALELLTTLIPEVITFERRLKHLATSNAPNTAQVEEASLGARNTKPLSPLEQGRAKVIEARKTPQELEKQRLLAEEEAERRKEIHGSVSLLDVANYMRDKMLLDPEAARIHVQPEDVKFVELAEDTDKIAKIGKFEIEIQTSVGKEKIDRITKFVEVVGIQSSL